MLGKINATVLFVDDLETCARFYQDMLGLEVVFTDDDSVVFRVEGQDFLLLRFAAAVDMLGENALLPLKTAGHRVLLCTGVEDVDSVYLALSTKGLSFLKPPLDQPWGRRTTYFTDPEGNLWEIYQVLSG